MLENRGRHRIKKHNFFFFFCLLCSAHRKRKLRKKKKKHFSTSSLDTLKEEGEDSTQKVRRSRHSGHNSRDKCLVETLPAPWSVTD